MENIKKPKKFPPQSTFKSYSDIKSHPLFVESLSIALIHIYPLPICQLFLLPQV